ncbi:MAG: chalcone isomerase family protein [Alphaproteobacteria bacterium]|nr:chalcone isomerase family protein [Alphaproteobacteria bacterium]
MRYWIVISLMLSAIGMKSAMADVQTARIHVPGAELVGQGRLKYLFWNVFDASLYASGGSWSRDKPFALSLSYLRDLSGESIVGSSVSEIRDQGMDDEAKLARWTQAMAAIFPDVDDKTTITGIVNEERHAVFYRNGEPIGTIRDPEFSKYFFDIWLGEETSQPELRAQLLDETS